MAIIVCWSDGAGNTSLDQPPGPIRVSSVDQQVDGEGDTTVQIRYSRIEGMPIKAESGEGPPF